MKIGTEDRKKVGFLALLALVAGYLVYTNVFLGPGGTPDRGGAPPAPQESARAGPGGTPERDTARTEALIPRLEETALGERNGESSGALKRGVQCRA